MKCSISCAKVFPCSSRRRQVRAAKRFREKSSSFPRGRAYFIPKNLHRLNTTFLCPWNSITHNRLRYGIAFKKKSEIMIRTAEKNRKQRFSNLPISIGSILKIAFVVAGFALWGWSFVAVVAGIYLLWNITKGVIIFLLSIAVIVGFILLLTVLIF